MSSRTTPIPFHPLADIFPLMEGDEFDALVADIKANGLQKPIITYEGMILDGRNRYRAWIAAGIRRKLHENSEVIRIGGPDRPFFDPAAYVISANIHRRHLTAEQKRELIAKLIKAQPKKSNRQIAKTAGVSHPHVAKVRGDLEKSGDVETVTTSIDTKGREQPAKKPQTKAERNRKALERRVAERRAKLIRQAELDAREEAQTKTEAERLAVGLIGADHGLARALHEFLVQCGADAVDLMDALGHLLGPEGNDADVEAPEAPAEAVEQPKRKRGRPRGSKTKPKTPQAAPLQRGEENAPPPDVGTDTRKAEYAALDDGADAWAMPEFLRRS
jgi:hypothetical protein